MGAHLYILKCSDGSYYVGTTRAAVEYRVSEHNEGIHNGYTKSRRPVMLAFSEYFDRITDAIAAERQVKGWSRAKKEALIKRNYDLLPELSRRRNRDRTPPRPSRRDAMHRPQDEEVFRGSKNVNEC